MDLRSKKEGLKNYGTAAVGAALTVAAFQYGGGAFGTAVLGGAAGGADIYAGEEFLPALWHIRRDPGRMKAYMKVAAPAAIGSLVTVLRDQVQGGVSQVQEAVLGTADPHASLVLTTMLAGAGLLWGLGNAIRGAGAKKEEK
jgi:hypothetical protein